MNTSGWTFLIFVTLVSIFVGGGVICDKYLESKQELVAAHDEVTQTSKKFDSCQESLDQANGEVLSLQGKNQKQQKVIESQEKQISDLKTLVAQLQDMIDGATATNVNLNQKVRDLEKENADLKGMLLKANSENKNTSSTFQVDPQDNKIGARPNPPVSSKITANQVSQSGNRMADLETTDLLTLALLLALACGWLAIMALILFHFYQKKWLAKQQNYDQRQAGGPTRR